MTLEPSLPWVSNGRWFGKINGSYTYAWYIGVYLGGCPLNSPLVETSGKFVQKPQGSTFRFVIGLFIVLNVACILRLLVVITSAFITLLSSPESSSSSSSSVKPDTAKEDGLDRMDV